MSEFQVVMFQAVDAPLSDEQLAFARRQSSRAEVTRWTLKVEYHHSSFRGDVDGLLQRGYDVFLQYANYGVREIKWRLPQGIPFAKSVWKKYVNGRAFHWKSDAKGCGGILTLCPYHEAGELDEVWETEPYLDAAVRVREQLISGDLRALYLLWLCAAGDGDNDPEETIEPPVPHGISDAAAYGEDLLDFFGLDPLLLVAAGMGVKAAPADESGDHAARWINALDGPSAKDLLLRFLTGDTTGEKARVLAEIRDSQNPGGWPTDDKHRTFDELLQATEALRVEEESRQAQQAREKAKRAAAKAERERTARMQEMRKNPDLWLRESQRLVDVRGTNNYQAAAEILFDLREALGEEGTKLARQCAANLAKKYPTLNRLKSELRKRALLE